MNPSDVLHVVVVICAVTVVACFAKLGLGQNCNFTRTPVSPIVVLFGAIVLGATAAIAEALVTA